MQKRAIFLNDKECIIVFAVIAIHFGIAFALSYHQLHPYESSSHQTLSVELLESGHDSRKSKQLSVIRANSSAVPTHSSPQFHSGKPEDLNSVRASSGDQGLESRNVFRNPRPPYPLVSRRMGQKGDVHLKLCVNPDGLVRDIWIAKTSGYAPLDSSALETVRAWRFLAVNSANSDVECYRLPINFTLES